MSNSAFTPFVQTNFPAASATVSGMVTTSAQTFAGKKTLDGGAAIKGATDGVAIAAGYVGEKITWVNPPSNFSLPTTLTDWTNASITLTAGVWAIYANVCIAASVNAGNVLGFATITDASNTIIQNQAKEISWGNAAASNVNFSGTIPFAFVLPTTGTTIKIRLSKTVTGTSSGTAYYQSGFYSEFFAIRIA